ncbi:unnamed protein product [Larinioides sclopetarius]|uniref:Uncharacterized protein n=1 Tax=Larinioides sclopetarius TaxID=280406 RepID=A0AAV2A6Q0_9ARAC
MADPPPSNETQLDMGRRTENVPRVAQASKLDNLPNEISGNNGEEKDSEPSDPTHFIIRLCKDYKISINKPLIPLKVALFTYYGGKTTSGLTSGLIMDAFGGKVAFRFNALLCLASVVLYGFFIFFRKRYISMKHKIDPSPQNLKVFHIKTAENGHKIN